MPGEKDTDRHPCQDASAVGQCRRRCCPLGRCERDTHSASLYRLAIGARHCLVDIRSEGCEVTSRRQCTLASDPSIFELVYRSCSVGTKLRSSANVSTFLDRVLTSSSSFISLQHGLHHAAGSPRMIKCTGCGEREASKLECPNCKK